VTLTVEDMDEHLRALGRHARDRLAEHPSEWEAVARGERSVEEVAAVRAEAGDSPEAIERAKALFRPFDEAEDEALVAALLGVGGREGAAPGGEGGAEVIALRGRAAKGVVPEAKDGRGARWLWGVAAAAAVVAVWLLRPGRPGPDGPEPAGDGGLVAVAPLPAYRLETDGGLNAMRGDTGNAPEVPVYRNDTPFAWTIRPQVAVEGEIEVRVYAQDKGPARLLPADDRLEIDANGAVRLSGRFASLGLAPGEWTIVLVVGRPSALRRAPEELLANDGEGWVVLRQNIVSEE
jgi:hypothetical protein